MLLYTDDIGLYTHEKNINDLIDQIQADVNFDAAINLMHRKAACRLRWFKYIRQSLILNAALLFAKSMILPYLDYCCLILSSASSMNIIKL